MQRSLIHRSVTSVLVAVLALGSLVAVPQPAEAASGDCSAGIVCRVAGVDRFATAVAVSQQTNGPGTSTVYVSVGTNFPDALAAGPAAAHEDAPILLVHQSSVPASTMAELQRLDPDLVVIVGGTAAVAESVATSISSGLPGVTIDRRWGAHRYDTAVAISEGAFAGPVGTVFVATGQNFPDALIAAPAAVAAGAPLLLVHPDGLHASVTAELQRLAPSTVVIIGDHDAVPSLVRAQIDAIVPTVRRLSAPDRHALSAAVAADQWPGGADTVYVARADLYPDALAAGPMTRFADGPLLLVEVDRVPAVVQDELDRLDPTEIVVLGGPAAVSQTAAAVLDVGHSSYENAIVSPGDTGPAVEYLQRLLTHARLYRGPIDGIYPNDQWEHPGTMMSAVYALHKLHQSPADDAWKVTDRVGNVFTIDDWGRLGRFRPEAPFERTGEPLRFEVDAFHEVMWMIMDDEVVGIFHVSVGGEFTYWWSGTKKYEVAHTPRGDLDVDHYWAGYREPGWMYRAWYYLYTHRWMAMHGYHTVPPYPASHGCVRVTWDDADWIYAQIGQSVGTPYHIWDGAPWG